MASETPTEGRCNAAAWLPGDKEAPVGERSKSGYCESYPVTDDDGEPITGSCRMHNGHGRGGASDGNDNAAGEHELEQDGNTNALQHGMFSGRDAGDLYPALDPADRQFVDDIVDKYIRFWGWGPDDPRIERLISIGVDIWREARAKGILSAEGPTEERIIGTNELTGEPIVVKEEHHLQGPVSDINQTIRMNLKDIRKIGPDQAVSGIGDDLTINVNVLEYDDGDRGTDADVVDIESSEGD